jgi:hypothetical protein
VFLRLFYSTNRSCLRARTIKHKMLVFAVFGALAAASMTEAFVPTTDLPDVLTFEDGSRVKSPEQWVREQGVIPGIYFVFCAFFVSPA